MNKNFYLILIVFSLNSCSAGHPRMSSFTPASVVVDYSDSDLHGATNLAQQFCSSINKNAQYVSTNIDNGWISKKKEAFFNCVESNKSHDHNNANSHSHTMPIINNFK